MNFRAVILSVFALMLLAAPVVGTSNTLSTVAGHVYDNDGNPIDGASVVAVCATGAQGSDITANGGLYVIAIECSGNTGVTVTATSGELTGIETGLMHNMGWITIEIVDIVLTPEFSAVIIPLLMSLAGFAVVRRKGIAPGLNV